MQGVGTDEARLRLTEGAGDGLLAAGDGGVSEVEGLGSRVHNDRWGGPTSGSERPSRGE